MNWKKIWNTETLTRLRVIFWHFSGKVQEYKGKCQSEQEEHPVKANRKYNWFSGFALSHSEHKHNCLWVWSGILKFVENNNPSCRDTNNLVFWKWRRRFPSKLPYVPTMPDGIMCQSAMDTLPLPLTLPLFDFLSHSMTLVLPDLPVPSNVSSSRYNAALYKGTNGLMDVLPSSWSFELAWNRPRLCLTVLKRNIYK